MESPTPARVLVVDDHPDAAEMLALLIRAACPGVETRSALDGASALDIARGWRPHAVVTDIDMPVLSGIEAALEMRSLPVDRQPAIAAVTGDQRWRDDPMAIAVFDVLFVKPVEVEVLLRWLHDALGRPPAQPHDAS